jgi:hypothetical protein
MSCGCNLKAKFRQPVPIAGARAILVEAPLDRQIVVRCQQLDHSADRTLAELGFFRDVLMAGETEAGVVRLVGECEQHDLARRRQPDRPSPGHDLQTHGKFCVTRVTELLLRLASTESIMRGRINCTSGEQSFARSVAIRRVLGTFADAQDRICGQPTEFLPSPFADGGQGGQVSIRC